MRKRSFLLFFTPLLLLYYNTAIAQEAEKSSLNIGADIFNRFVWRGLDFGSSPNIQPMLEYAHKSGFTIGCWGAFNTVGTYNEVDLYLSYQLRGFNLTFTDYFFPVSAIPTNSFEKYFNYKNSTTGHLYETSVKWEGSDKFPLSVLVGSFIYGGDKNSEGKQNYSSYAEIGYSFRTKVGDIEPFMGFTPSKGLYGNTMGVVNMGLSASRNVRITEYFDLPITTSLIVNPQMSNIYFLFGISL